MLEAADIERIEELRYRISTLTYEMLHRKKHGENVKELERQLAGMKGELDAKLALIARERAEYVSLQKKEIDDLKEEFMALDIAEKGRALEGEGRGAELVESLNNILKENYNSRNRIAALIKHFSSLWGEKDKIKRVLEGYEEAAVAKCGGSKEDILEFITAARELGFLCNSGEGEIFIGRRPVFHKSGEVLMKEGAVSNVVGPFEVLIEKDNKEVSASSAWLKEDVDAKISKILSNKKMQRWVLNTFKDEEEKKEYEKAQIVLAKLMKMKRQSEGFAPQDKRGGIRIWMDGERLNCIVPYGKGIAKDKTVKIEGELSELKDIPYEKRINPLQKEEFFFTRQRTYIDAVLFAAFP